MPVGGQDIPVKSARAPKTFHDLLHETCVAMPQAMARTGRTRRKLRRLRLR